MIVLFYSNLLNYTGGASSFEPKNSRSMRELIDELGRHFGGRFKGFILGDENCFFLLNGRSSALTGGLDSPLQQEDTIEALPFIEAG